MAGTGSVSRVRVTRVGSCLLLLLAVLASLLPCACREAGPRWEGVWTSDAMPGYRLEYHLGTREFGMKMTDAHGQLVMASSGTLEISGNQLLVTETARLVAGSDGRPGVWKSCSDIWQVSWAVDEQDRLSWKPEGTSIPLIFQRKSP